MSLQAVFFDIGGTLETFRTTHELRLEKTPLFRVCLRQAGIELDLSNEQLYQVVVAGTSAYHKWNRHTLIELPTEEVWSRFVFAQQGIPAEKLAPIAEELAYLYETQYYLRELRPEVPEVLETVKAMGLSIGAISNTQSLTQVPRSLKNYGILEYFDPLVLSSAFGRRKPDPSIFIHAARLANLPPANIAYVGDKINRDVLGATRAGFRLAVKISHIYDDGDLDEGAVPDARIDDLRELLPLLEAELQKDRRL